MNFSAFGAPKGACRVPIGDGRERPGEHFWAAKPHKHPGRLSTRTLRVFQCSAALNHMGGRKGSIQEWNMARYSSVIQAQIDEPLQVELTGHQMAYQSPLDRVTRRKGP